MCSSAIPLSSSGAARTRSGTVLSRVMLALPLPSCVISGKPPDLSVCSSERKTTNAYLSELSVVRITRNRGGGMPAMPSTQEASLPAGSSPCPHLLSFRRRQAGRPAQRWGPSERSSPCPPPQALPAGNPLLVPLRPHIKRPIEVAKSPETSPRHDLPSISTVISTTQGPLPCLVDECLAGRGQERRSFLSARVHVPDGSQHPGETRTSFSNVDSGLRVSCGRSSVMGFAKIFGPEATSS